MTKEKIPKQVYVLGFVSLFNDIASEMLYPVLPIFLTQVLGAPVFVIGIMEGIAEGTSSILKTFFGYLSDKLNRRKPFVFGGYGLSAISKIMIAVSNSWGLVFAGRVTDRLGKGVRTASRDAMLLGYSNKKNRGLVFGVHRSMDSAGAFIGPLIGLLLLSVFNTPLRTILLAAAIPSVLGLFLFLFVKEVKAPVTTVRKLTIWASIKGFSKDFKLFLIGLALFSLGNSSDTFLILKSKQIGLSITIIILAYVLYNACYSLFSTPAGIIADKIGAMKVFMIGLLLYALVYCGFALNTSEIGVFALFAVYGFYIAMTDGVAKSLVGSFVTQEQSGTAYGLVQTVMGLSTLAASIVGGFIWSLISPSATFYFGALCAALSFVFFIICFGKKTAKQVQVKL